MKILVLANNDVGLYQFRRELIAELLKEHDVYLSLPYGKLVKPLIKMGCHFIDTPIDRRGLNPAKDLHLLTSYKRIIKNVRPDLVITYTIKPNVYGGVCCRLFKVPYAVNITGLGTVFQKQGPLRTFVTMMYREGLRRAKVVFFENRENQRFFIQEKIIRKQQCCLLNGAGVNLDHYQVFAYPEDEHVRFLFIGRIMKEKGINELFTAMRMLIHDGYSCSLDLLGEFEEDYKSQITMFEQEGWLRYHGYQEDVRPFIRQAHCFVLPSWHEGMANTNLECAASGRPVITSNIHGCKEAVDNGVTGYLCQRKQAKSLYEAMKRFLSLDIAGKKQMGLCGRARMERYFDKHNVVQKTILRLMQ